MRFTRYGLLLNILMSWGNVFSQAYTYDASGSLNKDSVKQIASIHHNHLNLTDTITYADGRKILYIYTAGGKKLEERAIAANGTVIKKRNYLGEFLYSGDSLKEIQHKDGRAVPILSGNSITPWEYQYHLQDHLGNVRLMLTAQPNVDSSNATFETTRATGEQKSFVRYEDVRRINAALFDHTHLASTQYSERLNGSANEKYGLAKSLSVMPGDVINLEVYAKYVDPEATHWTAALATLMSQIASGLAPAGTVVDGSAYPTNGSTPFAFAGLNGTSNSSGSGPKAYLNWLVFDRNFVFQSGGFVRMSTAAKENGSNVSHERLASTLVVKKPGYVYVYLSNEETTPLEVYFDDLSVTQVMGPVIQQTDYDPLGLTFNDFSRESTAPNNFLYNGKELRKDFDLNWYDYGARMYDVALGRWHVIDPKTEKYAAWSPYNYTLNNPVNHTDPDGKDAFNVNNEPGSDSKRVVGAAREIPEGQRIMKAVTDNHNIAVYYAIVNRSVQGPEDRTPQGKETGGKTTTIGGDVKVMTTSKGSFLQVKEDSPFHILNGIDVTEAVKKHQTIYVSVVGVPIQNYLNRAYILLHEIGAHVEITEKTVYAGPAQGREAYEHQLFGDAGTGASYEFDTKRLKSPNTYAHPYKLTPNTITPGSTADKVAKQLEQYYRYRPKGDGN